MRINADRLNANIEELGEIGYREGKGVTRLSLSEEDIEGRNWLKERMEDAGLEVSVDEAANLIGRLQATVGSSNRVLLVGSHLDTVRRGGRFDGALGVLAGLECAQTLAENDIELPWDLEIVDFTDEEGYHYAGTFGSRMMMGEAKQEEIYQSKTDRAPTLAEDLAKMGLDPKKVTEAYRPPEEIEACLEIHIEQGARLEKRGLDIAAVTGIVGIYRYTVQVMGEANHAGTTPMEHRSDALVKASPVLRLLPEWARARSEEMVATVGQIRVEPGSVNVIPELCEFSVELRSLDNRDMCRVRDRLRDWLRENVEHNMSTVFEKDGVKLEEDIVEAVLDAAADEDLAAEAMPSGAGHDAQTFAPLVPTGMIFIPSHKGKSHCPEEYSKPEWVANGAQVLLNTIMKLARN